MSSPLEKIKESLSDIANTIKEAGSRRLIARVQPKNLRTIFDKFSRDFKEDFYLDFLVAVDYLEEKQFELNYGVWIYSLKTLLTIKTRIQRENPTIETISDVIPSAGNHEREAYDLMGIIFSGNNALRRGFLVTEEITDSFPLRKDWVK